MYTISIEIPQVIWDIEPNISILKRRMIEYLVLDEYQNGKISIREGARILGMNYEEFMDFLGMHHISFINVTPEEQKDSYANFRTYMQQHVS